VIFVQYLVISWKRYNIGTQLLWKANRNSYALYRVVLSPMTPRDPYYSKPSYFTSCPAGVRHIAVSVFVLYCIVLHGLTSHSTHYRSFRRRQRVCMFACLAVCMSARICKKSAVQISSNFLYILPAVVARSFSDDTAVDYVLPVLWMTSCFNIMNQIGQNHAYIFPVCQVAAPGRSLPSRLRRLSYLRNRWR